MTILEVIQRSADFLTKKGVSSPRLQVELLLAHALRMPRMNLYLNFSRVLSEPELEMLRGLVQRRGAREPLQYIVGTTSFCGLEVAVNPHVLIPRPETELLAERAWTFLAERAKETPSPAALDFGTGSGCLAISLAVHVSSAQIVAIDYSPEALALARANAQRHPTAERIQFFQGDGFAAVPKEMRFDLIVSNPPYIPTAEIETLEPEVREHEPRAALDGGADGLDFYRRISAEAKGWLRAGGRLMLELGDSQAESVRALFETQKWVVESIEPDYNRHPRILIASV